jgi:hypothetical protein
MFKSERATLRARSAGLRAAFVVRWLDRRLGRVLCEEAPNYKLPPVGHVPLKHRAKRCRRWPLELSVLRALTHALMQANSSGRGDVKRLFPTGLANAHPGLGQCSDLTAHALPLMTQRPRARRW